MPMTVHGHTQYNDLPVAPKAAGSGADGAGAEAVWAGRADGFDFAPSGTQASGGFSDVSGLGTEISCAKGAQSPEWHLQGHGDPGGTMDNDLDNGRLVCEVGVAIEPGADDLVF